MSDLTPNKSYRSMKLLNLLIESHRMNKCKRLERKLCKAASKFMNQNIVRVLKYEIKEKSHDL